MADDEKTGPSGKPIYKRVAGPRTGAGHVALRVEAVHTHECPYWHMGRRHRPCRCGANDLMERIAANHGAVVPCLACGAEAAHVDLGVFGYVPQAHRSPQGFLCHGPHGPVAAKEARKATTWADAYGELGDLDFTPDNEGEG